MLATQLQVSDGTLHVVQVGIEFFNQADISVSLNQGDPLVLGTDYVWSAGTTITFLATTQTPGGLVPAGVEVLLRRDTKNDEMYNTYDGGAPFSRLTLDENFEQLLRLSQEFSEGLGLDGLRANLSMHGYRITDLGNPLLATDAANKRYIDTLIAALITSGTGPIGAAVNVMYTDPYGVPKNLQQLSAVQGSDMIMHDTRTVSAKISETVSIMDFPGVDNTGVLTSTTALAAALATGRRVYIPKGTYRLNLSAVPNGAYMYGDGPENTIIKPLTNTARGAITVNSSSASTFIDNLTFKDMKFLGDVVAAGFSEQVHLLTLNGVRDVLVENVHFIGFRGDGCYLGSGDVGGSERHNFNVTIRKCLFDGLNNDNRNAVSIIDGTNVTLEDNVFQNCTRFNMPGAIDIEPDNAAYHVINGVKIVRNKFRNVGGNLGTVSLFMGSSVVPSPTDIWIDENDFEASVTTSAKADIFVGTSRALNDGSPWSGVHITNNNGRTGGRALDIRAIKGVHIEGNNWIGYTLPSRFGIQSSTLDAPREVYHANNRYIGNASAGGPGLQVGNIDYLTNDGNSWEECGNGLAGSAGIEYLPGTCTFIKHYRNKFKDAGGTMLQGILHSSSGKSPATDTQLGDVFLNNLSNQFVAYETDMKWNTYTPVIVGTTTAGTGVYGANTYGRFMRVGKTVTFAIHIECTSHSGTGFMRIGVPIAAATQADASFPVGSASSVSLIWPASGAAGIASSCVINTAAVISGVAGGLSVQGYPAATPVSVGPLAGPTSGSFMVTLSGTYTAA